MKKLRQNQLNAPSRKKWLLRKSHNQNKSSLRRLAMDSDLAEQLLLFAMTATASSSRLPNLRNLIRLDLTEGLSLNSNQLSTPMTRLMPPLPSRRMVNNLVNQFKKTMMVSTTARLKM